MEADRCWTFLPVCIRKRYRGATNDKRRPVSIVSKANTQAACSRIGMSTKSSKSGRSVMWISTNNTPWGLLPLGKTRRPSQSGRSFTRRGLTPTAGPASPPHPTCAPLLRLLEQNIRFLLPNSRQKSHLDRRFSNPSFLFPHLAVSFLRNSSYFIWIPRFSRIRHLGEREGFVF